MLFVIAFLVLLLLAAVAGAVLALRDTIVGDAVRVPTRPELIPADLAESRR